MTIREQTELLQEEGFCEYASRAGNSRGRMRTEEPCSIRTDYQRDRDRILHSNSFRRLKHKTQVFLSPVGDHYRTRLTHTLEVSQIARTITRALRLNEDLAEAIALGHDLGHTPFGHAGEDALNGICPGGFHHYEQSVRVVDYIENDGRGLNLTEEVRDGILCHTNRKAFTPEGVVVKLSDKIAYINHDIEDAIRAGIIEADKLPKEAVEVLGDTKSKRITTLVSAVVEHGSADIGMPDLIQRGHDVLRAWLFREVYTNPVAKAEENKAQRIIAFLYGYYLEHTDELPAPFQAMMEEHGRERIVCDYIAGMTDGFAIAQYSAICIPKGWNR